MLTIAAVLAPLGLAGCGGVDGISLNGAMFDWMGISDSAMAKGNAEPKVAERAPLVLPPDTSRLPEPGAANAAIATSSTTNNGAWPVDPETRKVADAKERERLHQAYCRGELGWQDRALNPQASPKSPYGPCSTLGSIVKQNTN